MAQEQCETQSSSELGEAREFGSSNNIFSFKLYQDLVKRNSDKNVFYSPYSISSAMAMVLLGCEGLSESQLKSALSLGGLPHIHGAARALMQALLQQNQGIVLDTANRLFPEKSYQLKESFLANIKKYYDSGVEEMDYKGNPEGTRKTINDWVYQTTKEKIKDLLPSGSITRDTRLVLANAVYFKGSWETEFQKSKTVKREFHVSSQKVAKVDLMTRKANYNFTFDEAAKLQLLEIPYKNNTASMVIALPTDQFGLTDMEEKLDASKLSKLEKSFRKQELLLGLPKFKLEFESDLVDSFKSLGATSLFSGDADFEGMTESKDIAISAIAHKAFVEVNEEGTEAAAATGAVMTRMALLPPMEFMCDHPFLFYIKHKPTGTILFTGRYINPDA